MADKVIITCAITGSFDTPSKSDAVPVTPKQIADSAIGAAKAGAAVAHIHVRDPETAAPSMDIALYREVVERVRDADVDIVLNLTTGAGARYIPSAENMKVGGPGTTLCSPEERVSHVLELKPELCTLDIGTMNFGEHAFLNLPSHLRTMARLVEEAGTKPELEVFDIGHIVLAKKLIAEGALTGTPLFQICLGIPYGADATPQSHLFLQSQLPQNANWAAFGIGRQEFDIVALSAVCGGHVRVGLEDNLYLSRGVLAPDNASLVRRAVQILEGLGKETANAAEAREILELR
ncbi:BKACE family enzyme [Stappia indica]|uniref:3-keto-5-aminohexanoate cleavage protein n=1 Tax=Stappia indica TaxID=538381 RepID=UPI001CD7CEEC|nr:3-keto-5-aminohexanoate cleavage protein [Stappia indica]MCA1297083.1 3-keto-5-aminohexanoate cleavage protein [Stappia indica]